MNDPNLRYVLHPGYVCRTNGRGTHFIGALQLAQLYGLSLRSPSVAINSGARSFRPCPGDINLHPRFDGNYTLPGPSKSSSPEIPDT
jgi:hypothetical protein